MKIRNGYVSNSSSSSFLVPKDVTQLTECIKLPEDIWKNLEKYYIDYEGNKIELSKYSNDWWLTTLISDSSDVFSKLNEIEHSYFYLEGNHEPYGMELKDECFQYTVLKKYDIKYYLDNNDLHGRRNDDIPSIIKLREQFNNIINNKSLNKSQKLIAIKNIFDF